MKTEILKTNISTRATEMFCWDAITQMNCTHGDPPDQGCYPSHPASHNKRLLTFIYEIFLKYILLSFLLLIEIAHVFKIKPCLHNILIITALVFRKRSQAFLTLF